MNPIELLEHLIAIPSLSHEEAATADMLFQTLVSEGVEAHRLYNNVWAVNRDFSPTKPTILLNSHHDTVRPNSGYTREPYTPAIEHGRLYGLGSNDAGASVVSLMATFLHFYPQTGLNYNLCLALTAEEECSGELGIEALLPCLPKINCAIVGEPTLGQMAIGERGLMVLDCVAKGRSGHAAREEGDNAIYHALNDIEWFKNYRFAKVSPLFGPVKMSVTIINSGTQHNVVPAECRFTVDVRVTECYTLEQVLALIRENVTSTVTPRSLRLNPSKITLSHPLVVSGLAMGLTTYGSPTTSDAALLYGIEALKMGPGDSARSHSADEYVYISEVTAGIKNYITLLDRIL